LNPLRILVVSSVPPAPQAGGELVLHRHLIGHATLATTVVPEPAASPWLQRLKRTRLQAWANALEVAADGRRWLPGAQRSLAQQRPDVLLTAAHGDGCWAVQRLARQHGLPLVTFFHDWWPDVPKLPALMRRRLDRRFLQLYRESSLPLCVCPGMRETLGPHPRAEVLYPIPGAGWPAAAAESAPRQSKFRVVYSGNLHDYGPGLRAALETLDGHAAIELQVRGPNPRWPGEFQQAMRAKGLWLDFAPRAELEAWLAGADAFLIPMSFDPAQRRRMETSFPSKITDFAGWAKPLVVWGPDYCSAVRWAVGSGTALVVTAGEGSALGAALRNLARDASRVAALGAQARAAAEADFAPDHLQARFESLLRAVGAQPCASN
jgi:glycosyltransferase involved in cell wall biosynthesis